MLYDYDTMFPEIDTTAKEYGEGYLCAKRNGIQADNPYSEENERMKYVLWRAGWWDFVDADIEAALKVMMNLEENV